MVVFLWWCGGGVFEVVVLWCFSGGVVVVFCWLCGGVVVVVFLRWCCWWWCFCGGLFAASLKVVMQHWPVVKVLLKPCLS